MFISYIIHYFFTPCQFLTGFLKHFIVLYCVVCIHIALAVFLIFNSYKGYEEDMKRACIPSAQLITMTDETLSLRHHIGVLVLVCVRVYVCVFLTSYLVYGFPPESDHVQSGFGLCIEALQGPGMSHPSGGHRSSLLLNVPKGKREKKGWR